MGLAVRLNAQATSYSTLKTTNSKAKEAFEEALQYMRQKDGARAIRTYEKALKADPLLIDGYLYLAGAHFEAQHWAEAEINFEKALQMDAAYAPQALYMLAQSEWEQDKYEEAATHATNFLKQANPTGKLQYGAKRLAENAQFAAVAVKNPVPFAPQALSDSVNTAAEEYLPSFTADGAFLVFTRRERGDEDFYSAQRLPNGVWGKAKPMNDINTSLNEGAESISVDASWLVFTACNRRDEGAQGSCDLYWSQRKNEAWTKPVPFSATINGPSWDGQPCISADGKTLYFSSDRVGGQGGRDLWFSTRQAGGKWTTPENLGKRINTAGDEQTPFLHPDGQTLYFTSDGRPGMGENDLYLVRRLPDGTWGEPQNLGYPINTKKGDGTLTVSLDGKTAYFAAVRPEGRGKHDLYQFELPPALRPQPVTFVRATVRDAVNKAPLVAQVTLTDLQTKQEMQTTSTRADGRFLMCLPAGRDYAFSAAKTGYTFHSENFNLTEARTADKPFELEILLWPLPNSSATTAVPSAPASQPIVLRNVFFETGSSELKSASTIELDRLVSLLKANPTLRIQLNGHTDNVGDDKRNLLLSEQRAAAVLTYLTQQGIDATRLRAKGFGKTRPVDTNDTVEGRARNRRTEFEWW